jgi:glycosyltransferase involved in cell wall biosynthesis
MTQPEAPEARVEMNAFQPAWQGMRSVAPQPGKLTIIIPTKNEEHNIRECLESATWADEVIVCDSFSSDRTPHIALEYTPNVIQHEYLCHAAQNNWMIPQASSEWVMVLDADERITRGLRHAVRQAIQRADCEGWRVRRMTHFLGKLIRHCGWGQDYPLRLFRRQYRYQDRPVHSTVAIDGKVGQIEEHLEHYTDRDLRNYFEKLDRYTTLAAAERFRRGQTARWWHLLFKPPVKFLKMYLLKLGFLDGFHGFLLCGLSAMSTFARYAKLWEMNQRGSTGELPKGRPDR